MRLLHLVGLSYAAVCGGITLKALHPVVKGEAPAPAPQFNGPAGAWFEQVKPNCNALEAATRIRTTPPPSGRDGAAYAAACYALAGNIDSARSTLLGLSVGDRSMASSIVFDIGHPVADAGDDRSAGPIMELVLEFEPDNYMALYHAGMSEYALGQGDRARTSLTRFLRLYQEQDGWRANAQTILKRLDGTGK